MKNSFVMAILIGLVCSVITVGCVFNSYKTPVKIADVAIATQQFDDVKSIIKGKRTSFSDEDWNQILMARADFDEVVSIVIYNGTVSVRQLGLLRDSVKVVYTKIQQIIYDDLSIFSVVDRVRLQNFHERMVRIDSSIDELKNKPTADKMNEVLNMLTSALLIAAEVYPVL